jgi:hypothetical protein
MTEPARSATPDRVMFDGRAGRSPRQVPDDGLHEQRGKAKAVNPYHLVPAGSTRTLCGDYDVTGWRMVDVPWGGLFDCKECRAARGE